MSRMGITLLLIAATGVAGAQCLDYAQYIHFVGEGDEDAETYGVALNAGYAYVTDNNHALLVFDLVDPKWPALTGYLPLPGNAFRVVVDDDFAYIADGTSGLVVVDVGIPSSPHIEGALDTPGLAFGVAVAETLALVADGDIHVISIADPSCPAMVATLPTPGYARGVAVAGDLALVADYDSLLVVDMTIPSAPEIIGSASAQGAMTVLVQDGLAYVSAHEGGLLIFDVNDPHSPNLIGTLATDNRVWAVRVEEGYAYVAEGGDGFAVVDVSDPTQPVRVGVLDTPGSAWDVEVAGKYAYVSDDDGLRVIEIEQHASAQFLSEIEAGMAYDVAVFGDYAYLAEYYDMAVVDVSNPTAPFTVGTVDVPGYATAIEVAGTYAFVASDGCGLVVFDIVNPRAPMQVAVESLDGYEPRLALCDGYAYLLDEGGSLDIVDVRNPHDPVRMGNLDTSFSQASVTVQGSHAYVASRYEEGLLVIDVSDRWQPEIVETVDGVAGAVCASGTHLVVAGRPLSVLDISNPAHPVLVGTVDQPFLASDVAVADGIAYQAHYQGVWVVDVRDPAAPVYLGGVGSERDANGVTVAGDYVYCANYGLSIAQPQCLENSAVPWAHAAARLACSPAPAHESVHIRFDAAAAGPASLTVFDTTGRLVRRVLDGRLQAGPQTCAWDGRDQSGHPVESGVFRLVLATSEGVQTGQVIWVR
jgi:hypothetical protein